MSAKPVEILVVGAGAVGVYFSGRLAQAGAKVSVVARSDYEELKRNGGVYTIDGQHGDFDFKPERVLRSVEESPVKPDFILVALKLVPGAEPAKLCAPAVGEKTSFFVIQNGLGSDAALAKAFPGHDVIGSIAYIGASRPAPGRVHQQDSCKLTIGLHPSGRSESVELLHALFAKAGVACAVAENIELERWKKLLWNGPFNPISVLGNHADTKAIMELPETAALSEAVMEEMVAIAKAAGHSIPHSCVEGNIKFTRGMSAYKTSMLQDFEAGRPLEVEAILGDPLRVAERLGVPAPNVKVLYALLKLAARKL